MARCHLLNPMVLPYTYASSPTRLLTQIPRTGWHRKAVLPLSTGKQHSQVQESFPIQEAGLITSGKSRQLAHSSRCPKCSICTTQVLPLAAFIYLETLLKK